VLLIAASFAVATIGNEDVPNEEHIAAQPDCLHLGIVHTKAVVEASIRVLMPGNDASGLAVKVSPPPFVTVRTVNVGTQTYGPRGTRVFCDVMVAVKTTKAGEFAGALRVQVGEQAIVVPMTATVASRSRDLTRVLVVETPYQRFSTHDGKLFNAWKDVVTEGKLDVSYLDIDRRQAVLRDVDLASFEVVLLSGSGIVLADEDDLLKLKAFVDHGGRVVVVASQFMHGSVAKANKLIQDYGLRMKDREEPNGAETEAGEIDRHQLTEGIGSLAFHRPTSVSVVEGEVAKIIVHRKAGDGGYVAVANVSGGGEIIVLGVPLWWSWIAGEKAASSDNARLLRNALTRPRPAK